MARPGALRRGCRVGLHQAGITRMAEPRFEGSYLGDAAKLPDEARMECKICWHVYDPAEGDAQWQVPPGTPFHRLPPHWTCPQCEGAAAQFMVLGAG